MHFNTCVSFHFKAFVYCFKFKLYFLASNLHLFLFLNFRPVLNIVCFLHTYSPMKMEQTPKLWHIKFGNYPHESIKFTLTSISINPYPTAFPYGNVMVLHFYQQQESSTTKTVHKVINKGLKTYL